MAIANKTLRGGRHRSTPTDGASPAGASTLNCRTRCLDDLSAGQADGQWLVWEHHSSNTWLVTYTQGLDLSGPLVGAGGIGGLLARSRQATSSPYAVNGSSFYHADGNGNVTYLASASGSTDAAYKYDPFGRWLAQAGPYATANMMRFSSKPWVAHNGSNSDGLYYYGYRFYDPQTQRWLNRDAIMELGSINLYGFVQNKPTGAVDPFGWSDNNQPPVRIIVPNPGINPPIPFLPNPKWKPPGWSPTWPIGFDKRGPFVQDPKTGTKWYPHNEDSSHWPHYDSDKGKRFPEKCKKPWPNQKRPPYEDQSSENPWEEIEKKRQEEEKRKEELQRRIDETLETGPIILPVPAPPVPIRVPVPVFP